MFMTFLGIIIYLLVCGFSISVADDNSVSKPIRNVFSLLCLCLVVWGVTYLLYFFK